MKSGAAIALEQLAGINSVVRGKNTRQDKKNTLFGIKPGSYTLWAGNNMFKELYGCTFEPENKLSDAEAKLSKNDLKEMRKWAKKSRKVLLLELVRLQKQCHKNWEIAEKRESRLNEAAEDKARNEASLFGQIDGLKTALRLVGGQNE